MPPEAGFRYSDSQVFLSIPMEHSHMFLSCTSGPKLHHRCVLWAVLRETLLSVQTSPASCHLSPPVGAMVASLRYPLCLQDLGPAIMLALGRIRYMSACLCTTLILGAAGPSGKHVSLGMHMCSSLLVFPLSTVLMLNGTIVLIYSFFSAFWAVFRPHVSRSWIRSWNAYPPCACQMNEGPWSTCTPFTSPTVTSMACTISNR